MSPASTVAVTGQLADGSAATSEGLAVSGRRRISAPLHARPGRHAYCSAPRGNARAHPRAFSPGPVRPLRTRLPRVPLITVLVIGVGGPRV